MIKYNNNAIASNILSARLLRNYSQDYLASRLSISQNAYSKIERGQTKMSVEKLIIIAEVLETDLLKLIWAQTDTDEIGIVQRIIAVPKLLEAACNITGMGFAAIMGVNTNNVMPCSVRDEINMGFRSGRAVPVEATLWNEIVRSGEGILIEHVDQDEVFNKHPVPAIHGFQSYIAVPIIRRDGTFFGALCAMDRRPKKVNNKLVMQTFELFAELISCNLSL